MLFKVMLVEVGEGAYRLSRCKQLVVVVLVVVVVSVVLRVFSHIDGSGR